MDHEVNEQGGQAEPTEEEEREREHREGLYRVAAGLPYSREEMERERDLFEESFRLQDLARQRFLRTYHDYTLTILEFAEGIDLKKQKEWNSTLDLVFAQDDCVTIELGHDSELPQRILVFFGNISIFTKSRETH